MCGSGDRADRSWYYVLKCLVLLFSQLCASHQYVFLCFEEKRIDTAAFVDFLKWAASYNLNWIMELTLIVQVFVYIYAALAICTLKTGIFDSPMSIWSLPVPVGLNSLSLYVPVWSICCHISAAFDIYTSYNSNLNESPLTHTEHAQ